jgi:hypothetical protein
MVPPTIIRSPSPETHVHQPMPRLDRRPVRRVERGSLIGTILMVLFWVVLVSWVLRGSACAHRERPLRARARPRPGWRSAPTRPEVPRPPRPGAPCGWSSAPSSTRTA